MNPEAGIPPTRNPKRAGRNPHRATRNPKLVTRNPPKWNGDYETNCNSSR
jgi:hypothetical protein